ncbi:hypothetical protein ACFTXM_33550 [Streptomyces sp. NPDC056930]|uniref:hypothetical protein n=1 Tax=Streptomyces sp. NPDC056930 TaxID=3345967 RepID=UPI00362FAF25
MAEASKHFLTEEQLQTEFDRTVRRADCHLAVASGAPGQRADLAETARCKEFLRSTHVITGNGGELSGVLDYADGAGEDELCEPPERGGGVAAAIVDALED